MNPNKQKKEEVNVTSAIRIDEQRKGRERERKKQLSKRKSVFLSMDGGPGRILQSPHRKKNKNKIW